MERTEDYWQVWVQEILENAHRCRGIREVTRLHAVLSPYMSKRDNSYWSDILRNATGVNYDAPFTAPTPPRCETCFSPGPEFCKVHTEYGEGAAAGFSTGYEAGYNKGYDTGWVAAEHRALLDKGV